MNTTDGASRGDFLSTVIDRAHGRTLAGAPLVAPRPAGRFEPDARGMAEAIEAETAAPLPPVSPRAEAPFAPAAAPHIAPSPAAAIGPAAPPSAPPPVIQQIARTQHFHVAMQPPPSRVPPAAEVPALALPASTPRSAAPHDEDAMPAPRAPLDTAPPLRRGEAIVPRIDVPAPRTAASLPDRDVVAAFAAQLQGQAPAPGPTLRDTAAVAAPRPEPVVTISIGRVDVRVPAAVPAAPRAAAPQRPAGLSDYLGRKERTR